MTSNLKFQEAKRWRQKRRIFERQEFRNYIQDQDVYFHEDLRKEKG